MSDRERVMVVGRFRWGVIGEGGGRFGENGGSASVNGGIAECFLGEWDDELEIFRSKLGEKGSGR